MNTKNLSIKTEDDPIIKNFIRGIVSTHSENDIVLAVHEKFNYPFERVYITDMIYHLALEIQYPNN